MNETKPGYFLYSTFAVLFFVALIGFISYLLYDLLFKLSLQDFTNNTVIQALITLVITVFFGGYFTKSLELRGLKKIELYKIRNTIALKVIDLASAFYHNPNEEKILHLLIAESSKIKLYFPDEVLKSLNEFIKDNQAKVTNYNNLINELQRNV